MREVRDAVLTERFDRIDLLRAAAMVWMTVYHFVYDLDHFGFVDQNMFGDPVWTMQRTAIVSLFLFTAGLSQSVAFAQGQGWERFWRRWRQVAGAALLVSAASYAMFPRAFIYFGVLHGIAVMLVILRLTAGWRSRLWLAGAIAVAVGLTAGTWVADLAWADALNSRWLNWLGLISHKPVTQDYVPILPWLGVMWWGMAAGQWAMAHRPQWLAGQAAPDGSPRRWRTLGITMGRWSLSYYLLHQPVLMGLVWMALQVFQP